MPLISSLGVMNAINFGLASSTPIGGNFLAVATDTSSYTQAYKFSAGVGFGTKYANTTEYTNRYAVAINKSGTAIATAGVKFSIGTQLRVCAFSYNSGFGTYYAQPSTLPGTDSVFVSFNPVTDAISYATTASPYIYTYPFSTSTGFGTKYADPSTLQGSVNGINFNSAGTVIACAGYNPNVAAYPWSSGFGTKYANPATLPSSWAQSIRFNASGNVLAVGFSASPYILTYSFSSGFGSTYANPSTLPSGTVYGIDFNKTTGTIVCASKAASPYIDAYAWSSGFGARFSNPATLPASSCVSASFNKQDNSLLIGMAGSSNVIAYPWSNGFGVKYSDPATLPSGTGNYATFSAT